MKNKLVILCSILAWYPRNTCQAQAKSDSLPHPEMVFVEGGTFMMGVITDSSRGSSVSFSPAHRVTLSSFEIGKYEITQAEWVAVMGVNLSLHRDCSSCPVEEVSWNDIQLFIRTLNEKTGKQYRLPTAAQWEFAARGGKKSKGYNFSGSNNIDEVAWYGREFIDKTHPIGKKRPNELGIYDMTGNVQEWCNDWFDRDDRRDAQTNPQGPPSGVGHVIRGSSWGANPAESHVLSARIGYPDDRNAHVGFRLVLIK